MCSKDYKQISLGTGKSSTISKCTGRSVPAGNGRDRVTVRCDKYTVKEGRKEDPVWVDTVGWDDADLEDENTFKNILRYLKEKNLLRYKQEDIGFTHLLTV